MGSHQRHRQFRPGATDEDRDRAAERSGALLGAIQVEEATVVIHLPTGHQQVRRLEGLAESRRAGCRPVIAETEAPELVGHGSPTDTEFESTVGQVVERYHFLGQNGRVAELVAGTRDGSRRAGW